MAISWKSLSKKDSATIDKIVKRAVKMDISCHDDEQGLQMDIGAVHVSSPLRLQELLEADDFNFGHDVMGIQRHLDRETGDLKNFFDPRFTA